MQASKVRCLPIFSFQQNGAGCSEIGWQKRWAEKSETTQKMPVEWQKTTDEQCAANWTFFFLSSLTHSSPPSPSPSTTPTIISFSVKSPFHYASLVARLAVLEASAARLRLCSALSFPREFLNCLRPRRVVRKVRNKLPTCLAFSPISALILRG